MRKKVIVYAILLVLVMTVNPGFSGQALMPEVVPKINEVRKLLDKINPAALIEVDGGINPETISLTLENGAQVFVAASAIFNHPQGIKGSLIYQVPWACPLAYTFRY